MIGLGKWLITAVLLLTFAPQGLDAQGAWLPPNANLTHPRTVTVPAQLPALLAWLDTNAVAHSLYAGTYADAWGTWPGTLNANGPRRSAAHTAKNCAFAYYLDHKPLPGGGLDTLTATESLGLRDKALLMLNSMNTNVETYPDFGNYIWRANEITDNLIAYDLLKGAGVSDSLLANARRLLHEYVTSFHTQVAFNTFGLGLTSLHVDNHTLRACGALGMAAVVLNDADSSAADGDAGRWIQTALYHIDNVLWRSGTRQSEPGVLAGYSEGPHYLRFGMRHCLEFFRAMAFFVPDGNFAVSFDGNNRTVRHPYYDPNFNFLWEWVTRIRMPDGRDPQIEDNFAQTYNPDMALMGNAAYHFPYHGARFNPTAPLTLADQLHHSSDDVVVDYLCAMVPMGNPSYDALQVLPASGDLVMRSGWDSTSTYFHISAKNGRTRTSANGHNHVDVTSFILHARGQELAIDPGYLQWERRDEVDGPSHHNMILVDGAGPIEASTGNAGDADGFLENAFDLAHMDYAEARATYLGATIHRKPLFVRQDYFVVSDRVEATGQHAYTWQLHALGLAGGDSTHGSFTLDSAAHSARWDKNGVSLRALVTATGDADALTTVTANHELRYDSAEAHTALRVVKSGSNTSFLAVLVPHEADSVNAWLACGAACDLVMVERGGFRDAAFVGAQAPTGTQGMAHDLASDAHTTFYSETMAGDFAQWMLQGGRLLQYGVDTLAQASVASNWALASLDSVTYEAWAGAAGTIRFHVLGFVPQSVLGWGVVSGWSYDSGSGWLTVDVQGPGRFTIHKDFILGGSATAASGVEVWPNPATHAVHIAQRAAAGGSWEICDVQGRALVTGPLDQAGNAEVTGLQRQLAAGIYVVRVSDAGGAPLGAVRLVLGE